MNSLEDPRIAAALDNLHRRAARDWIMFALALPGACIFCDEMKGFRRTLKPCVDYVRGSPARYQSLELPLGDGLEFSIRL